MSDTNSYKGLLTEYAPTKYIDPMTKGLAPYKLSNDKLNSVCELLFTGKAEKQGNLLRCVAGATSASAGIKSHETRNHQYKCFYNNPADVILTINKKLAKNGFKFFIYEAKPSNKAANADSWLLWIVIPVQLTLRQGKDS